MGTNFFSKNWYTKRRRCRSRLILISAIYLFPYDRLKPRNPLNMATKVSLYTTFIVLYTSGNLWNILDIYGIFRYT